VARVFDENFTDSDWDDVLIALVISHFRDMFYRSDHGLPRNAGLTSLQVATQNVNYQTTNTATDHT